VTAIQLNIKFSSTETQRIIEAFLRSPIEIRKISLISTFIIQFQITLLPKQIVHILATLANQAEETCVEELLQNTINRYLTDIRLLNSPNPFPIFLKELSNCLILWAPRVFFLKVFEELRKKINHLPDKKIILEPLIKEILQYENKDRVNEIISMMLNDSFYFPILYELANSNRDLDIWLPKSRCDLLQSEEPMFDFPPSPRSYIDIAVIYPELEINENFNI
jgi:hypothetical protein